LARTLNNHRGDMSIENHTSFTNAFTLTAFYNTSQVTYPTTTTNIFIRLELSQLMSNVSGLKEQRIIEFKSSKVSLKG